MKTFKPFYNIDLIAQCIPLVAAICIPFEKGMWVWYGILLAIIGVWNMISNVARSGNTVMPKTRKNFTAIALVYLAIVAFLFITEDTIDLGRDAPFKAFVLAPAFELVYLIITIRDNTLLKKNHE